MQMMMMMMTWLIGYHPMTATAKMFILLVIVRIDEFVFVLQLTNGVAHSITVQTQRILARRWGRTIANGSRLNGQFVICLWTGRSGNRCGCMCARSIVIAVDAQKYFGSFQETSGFIHRQRQMYLFTTSRLIDGFIQFHAQRHTGVFLCGGGGDRIVCDILVTVKFVVLQQISQIEWCILLGRVRHNFFRWQLYFSVLMQKHHLFGG